MKIKLAILALGCLTLITQAANLTPGVNPPAVTQFAWNLSPDPTVDGYRIYYGAGPGAYTNVVSLPNVTNYNFTMPVRGVTLYFVVTATAAGLESPPSNEVSVMAKAPPSAPNLKPPVILVVQSKPASDPAAQWADLFNATLPDDAFNQVYRTKLTLAAVESPGGVVNASPQVRAIRALHAEIQRPPTPGKN